MRPSVAFYNRIREETTVTSAEKHYEKMTQTPIPKLILNLGIPTTISMLITSIYNMADTYFVGTIGESAQAATGVMFTVQAVMQGIAYMLGHGSGTFVSRSLAEQDTEGASRYFSSAFFLGGSCGVGIMLLGLLFLNPLVTFLGSTPTIAPHAMAYGRWILLAAPFMICSLIMNNGLRYEGKAFYAMIGLTSGGVLNILGDYILVMRLGLGVYGAGLATAVSQVISFCILLFMFRHMAQSSIHVRWVSRQLGDYLSIMKVGFPSFIRQSLTAVSTGVLNNVTKPFGDAAIAAMSIVGRYTNFMMCVGLGIGQGFQPVASFNYPAKKYRRVRQGMLFTTAFVLLFVGTISGISFLFAEPVIGLFQKQPQVIAIGAQALRCSAVGMVFMCLSIPVNMLYQSIQKPGVSTVLSLLRSGAITIPVLLLGVPLLGLTAIQIAQPAADILSGLVSIPFILHVMHATGEDGHL